MYEMISDFLDLYERDKKEWLKQCDLLFTDMKQADLISLENKFSLTSDRLD